MATPRPTKPREVSDALKKAMEEARKEPPNPNSILDRIPVRKEKGARL
jgi:hypothetical protein